MSSIWEAKEPDPRHFWIRLSLAAGLVLMVAAAYSAGQSSDQPKTSASADTASQPTLSGTWKLNRDESDDPREKLRSAIQDREQNGSPGGMGRHGGMGGGGMGGGIGMGIPGIGGGMGHPGSGQRGGSGSDEQHARLRDVVRAPDQVSIVQKGPEIDLTDTDNRVRSLFHRRAQAGKTQERQQRGPGKGPLGSRNSGDRRKGTEWREDFPRLRNHERRQTTGRHADSRKQEIEYSDHHPLGL